MLRTSVLATVLFLIAASFAAAQYGEGFLDIARTDPLTASQAYWLVGSASGSVRPETDISEARASLDQLSIALPIRSDADAITLGEYCYLITQLFDVQGGFWFGLLPGPFTALGVLQAIDVVDRSAHAGEHLSGPAAIEILRRYLAYASGKEDGADG